MIAARLARVVYAVGDPDLGVAGAGAARMKAAGLAVETDVLADAAYALNLGFFSRVTRRRPMFTLKMATSLDGRIATRTGVSQWITGPGARAPAHRLRAEQDAIMVGRGPAVADDPALTCRLPACANDPRCASSVTVDCARRRGAVIRRSDGGADLGGDHRGGGGR